jgi:hypothetical protein
VYQLHQLFPNSHPYAPSHQPAAAITSGMMLQHRYTEIAPVFIAIGIVFRDAQQSRVTKARIIANMNLFSIFCPPVPCFRNLHPAYKWICNNKRTTTLLALYGLAVT